jgi:hypothetical protein
MHTLEGVLSAGGAEGFESWLGPTGERHDFRMGTLELEVKSTLQAQRVHTINGLAQLEATPGKTLYVISLQYQRSGQGAGRSLPDLVGRVRHLLVSNTPHLERLETYLSRIGYRDVDAPFYDERLELRSAPVAVHVDAEVPRITPTALSPALDDKKLSRISDVTYFLNLDGFGMSYGSPTFKALLPMIRFDSHARRD